MKFGYNLKIDVYSFNVSDNINQHKLSHLNKHKAMLCSNTKQASSYKEHV